MPLFGKRAGDDDTARADRLIAQGQAEEDRGAFTAAEGFFRQAVAAAPRHARAHLNLGNALKQQGRLQEAIDAYRAAVEAQPQDAPAHCNLGVALALAGNAAEAQRRFELALQLAPGLYQASLFLARLLVARGDLAGATRHLQRALEGQPIADLQAELAELLVKQARYEEARAACHAALALAPGHAPALLCLGRMALSSGDARTACEHFGRAVAAAPSNAEMWAAYLMTLNVRTDISPEAIAREHFRFGEAFDRAAPAAPAARSGKRPLRVGYVSGDYKASPVAWFIAPVLEHHDPDRVETFCYSNVAVEDEVTARIRPLADHWRPIHGANDEAVRDLVRADGIDILVDLSGHTLGNRLALFAMRAAPVQASWLGYLNTTGLQSIDFRITDAHTDPEGMTEHLHSEALARMPHSQWCWVPFHEAPPRPAEHHGQPVFGSFNYAGKVNDATLDLWAQVLRAVPGSELRVHAADNTEFRATVTRKLEARGVAATRVSFVAHLPIDKYFEAFNAVDIALDTFPYNGGTTTFTTYWMGVPMVALPGDRGIARGSYSIARSAGLDELVARDAAHFVELNASLALDPAGRARLSAGLRDRLMRSVLGDAARFTRDLESLYAWMIERKAGRLRAAAEV